MIEITCACCGKRQELEYLPVGEMGTFVIAVPDDWKEIRRGGNLLHFHDRELGDCFDMYLLRESDLE